MPQADNNANTLDGAPLNAGQGIFESILAVLEKHKYEDAIRICEKILAADPHDAGVWHLLSIVSSRSGRLSDARNAAYRAIQLSPRLPDYHNTLGVLLATELADEPALKCFERALSLKPNYPAALNNAGASLERLGRLMAARERYLEAITLDPEYAEARNNLGNVFRQTGHFSEAISHHRHAIRLKPALPSARNNLGVALQEVGQANEATSALRKSVDLQPRSAAVNSNLLHSMLFRTDIGAEEIFREHLEWDCRHGSGLGQPILPHGSLSDPDRALRVGYLSPDFRDHPMPRFLKPILLRHDPKRIEAFCYGDFMKPPDKITEQLRQSASNWRDVTRQSDEALAATIRGDNVDILVDLAGHMANRRMRVFASKPAPVQVSYLGYPFSTGLRAMDYRLTDVMVDPDGATEHLYSEQLFRLNRCCWCYDAGSDVEVQSLPALKNAYVTFGVFNRLAKVHPGTVRLWAEILQKTPGSKVLVIAPNGDDADPLIKELFSQSGLQPHQLLFVDRCNRQGFLELHHRIDISLDTFPYNGMTTTCDAAWMGVPTVTLEGTSCVSRTGNSILMALGLRTFVARTEVEYVRIAVNIASQLDKLASLRAGLRERMRASPLGDFEGLTREIEAAYRAMWTNWCGRKVSAGS